MKKQIILRTWMLIMIFGMISGTCYSCSQGDPSLQVKNEINDMENSTNKITIKVGSKTFTATLLDNEAANSFFDLLPLKVTMTELNRNEKYYRLPKNLPTNPANPGTIHNGDLMLWGANTVVIFYETFDTNYSYTRLGKIDDPDGLKAALGAGNVSVSFSKE